jgi:DNA-binding LytR/AlgR family response regulator
MCVEALRYLTSEVITRLVRLYGRLRWLPNRRATMTLKVLIVDNELLERASLIEMCEQRDDVQIVGQADSGLAALRAADELCPDVMLVDVELPDMSGFDLLSAVDWQGGPLSIIVTGGPNSAAAALAAGALDYLLKPVDAARLGQSLEWAQHRRPSPRASACIPRLAPRGAPSGLTVSTIDLFHVSLHKTAIA